MMAGPFTLAIDIGGTQIKGSVLDPKGRMVAERIERPTPERATPRHVLRQIEAIASALPPFERISAGFPGAVRRNVVLTAPNLGTADWSGLDLAKVLSQHFGKPARVLNDAAVQGLGVVEGRGLECVLTLGTGMGSAVYRAGALVLPLELGQHRARNGLSYDQYVGNSALEQNGREKWNRRVKKSIEAVSILINYDVLYIGGGNARKLDLQLPNNVKVVSNKAGITGGVRLWDSDMEEHFA
jgi:polyphosphate glucokinase